MSLVSEFRASAMLLLLISQNVAVVMLMSVLVKSVKKFGSWQSGWGGGGVAGTDRELALFIFKEQKASESKRRGE